MSEESTNKHEPVLESDVHGALDQGAAGQGLGEHSSANHDSTDNLPVVQGPEDERTESIDYAIERNKYVFDLVNHWIESADSKVSTSYTVFAVLVTLITTISGIIPNANQTPNKCILSLSNVAMVIGYLLFITSVVLHSLAVKPGLFGKKNKKNVNEGYSIFFEDIKEFKNADEYIKAARKVKKEELNDSLLSEIYYNSKIASRKMAFHGQGQLVAMFAIVLLIISMVLKYVA